MMEAPLGPLVTATGRPRSSGKSRCSMDAKNAFMSTRMMARGQGVGELEDMGATFWIYTVFIYSIRLTPVNTG